MAEEQIRGADYERFLDANGMRTPACPLCGHSDWAMISELPNRAYVFLNADRRELSLKGLKGTKVLLLTCKTCWFIAPILREKVAEFLETGYGEQADPD